MLTLSACEGSKSATVTGTLWSTGATISPAGFAVLIKNANNSFSIQFFSSDLSIVGQSYQFELLFTEATASICQITTPVKVQVKCAKIVDCSAST